MTYGEKIVITLENSGETLTETQKKLYGLFESKREMDNFVGFVSIAKQSGNVFRKERNPAVIVRSIMAFMTFAGLSRTEANHVLTLVKTNLALQNSVVSVGEVRCRE